MSWKEDGWHRAFDGDLPEPGARVILWFEHTGMSLSYYTREEYPEEVAGEKGIMADVFYDRDGFLTDEDVYWKDATSPFPEIDEKRKKETEEYRKKQAEENENGTN